MQLAIRIEQYRTPLGAGYVDAFFTTRLGIEDESGAFIGLIDVRDCELRHAQGGEQYIKFPAKPRLRKREDGAADYVKDGTTGRAIYDSIVDFVREKVTTDKGEEWFPTAAAKKFKADILAAVLAQAQGQQAESSGRGSSTARAAQPKAAPVAPAARPAVAANTGTAERGTPLASADDDDLPFS